MVDHRRQAGQLTAVRPYLQDAEVLEDHVLEVLGVQRRLADVTDNPLLTTPAGGMTLEAYLPTRVFELAVHTLDLAKAVGAPAQPPADALALSLRLASDLALRRGQAETVLRALTGRQPLPDGFSLV